MIDREKVIRSLELCKDTTVAFSNCDRCPYRQRSKGKKDCFELLQLDAIALLKADQEYLQDMGEQLQAMEDAPTVPLKGLSRWLVGYAAPPRDAMHKALKPGEVIDHNSMSAAWEIALRGIDWRIYEPGI